MRWFISVDLITGCRCAPSSISIILKFMWFSSLFVANFCCSCFGCASFLSNFEPTVSSIFSMKPSWLQCTFFCDLSHLMNNFRKSTTLKLFVPFSHWPQNNWLVGSGGKKAIMTFVCSALHALVTLRCGWLEKESARKMHNEPTLMATRNAKKPKIRSHNSRKQSTNKIKSRFLFTLSIQ